ncbi:MAG TPA: hypothetical protein VIZ65_16590 [Cellvibrionaceae bacterium]
MFSFLSQLIGCAQASPLSGPDFTQPIEKVIHMGHRLSIFYLMPGNFSKELNFDKLYQRDSAKSFQINPDHLTKPETYTWREYEFIDVGKWDYWGKKSQGPDGQLGSLRVGIDYSLLPKDVDLLQHIKQSYEKYLNGEKGLNQKYRTDDMGKPVSAEEYVEDAVKPPTDFQTATIGGARFITWRTDREFDGFKNKPLVYYVLPIDKIGYVTFMFKSSISVFGQDMVIKQEQRIQQDITEFLSHISVKPL